MRQIEQLAAAHTRAALRFALIVSVMAEMEPPDELTDRQQEEYDRASDAVDAALMALIDYVPVSTSELKYKARYLLSRHVLGDLFDSDLLPALLRSIADFRPVTHAA